MAQDVVIESGKRLYITATDATIKDGYLMGVTPWVAGTVTVADTSGTIMPAYAVIAGQYIPLPCKINGTLTVTLAGGANSLTVFYN